MGVGYVGVSCVGIGHLGCQPDVFLVSFCVQFLRYSYYDSFQLNSDWVQVEVIDLLNDGTGLGFGIIGGKSTGVVVKTILPGGVADKVRLCLYMQVFCSAMTG